MVPSLSPLSSDASAGGVVDVPPPPRFRAVAPPIQRVDFIDRQTTFPSGATYAQRAGLRYEELVTHHLRSTFPATMVQPLFEFYDAAGFRLCRPDAIVSRADRLVVLETKKQHVPEAWWQLEKLYRPVLEAWRPEKRVFCVEIVRSFDPAMPFPTKVELLDDISEILEPQYTRGFAVWKWKP
jgi:hypothetical protein